MSSYVYYKFKAQKTETRIAFDGTGISVFDLKKEIILSNSLGKATDFDLLLFDSTEKEYTDDSFLIPRSTSVIAKRMPPSKPGKGKAAMYVAGAAPALSSNSRQDARSGPSTSSPQPWNKFSGGTMSKRFDGKDEKPHSRASNKVESSSSSEPGVAPVESNVAEDEAARIKAMFQANAEHWEETQERMSHATPIYNNRTNAPKRQFQPAQPAHVFESKPLPPGYICHRCSKRGHWIQDCPTNDDRDYDNRPRIKRTTGIPRSFLKSVDVPSDGAPQGVMVTPEGGFVIAQPDSASWEKQRARAAPLTASDIREKPPQDPTLACPICSKLLRDAVKTPCCSKTYDEECIQTHLLESDFVCPSCHSKVASLDKVTPDHNARERVRKYIDDEIAKSTAPLSNSERNTPEVVSPPAVSDKGKAPQTSFSPPLADDSEVVYDAQPGSTPSEQSNSTGMYNTHNYNNNSTNNNSPSFENEMTALQNQIQSVIMMMNNPGVQPPMRLQLQVQLQQLTMQMQTLQQMALYGGGSAQSFGMNGVSAMGMGAMLAAAAAGMHGQMGGGSNGFGSPMGGYGGGVSNSYNNGHVFNNPGLLSDAESPYQRVAPNNRRRGQKRDRPEDFVNINGTGQKYPRFYE